MSKRHASVRGADSLVAECSVREMAAREAFAKLKLRGFIGRDEMEEALIKVASSTEHIGEAASISEKRINTFLKRNRRRPPTTFDEFVEIYNDMVLDVHTQALQGKKAAVNFGLASANEPTRRATSKRETSRLATSEAQRSSSSDPEVSDGEAKKLAARQSFAAEFAKRSGAAGASERKSTAGARPSKFVAVQAFDDAPELEIDAEISAIAFDDGIDRDERRRRRSLTETDGRGGSPSPENSPEFQRSGRPSMYDYNTPGERERAKKEREERIAKGEGSFTGSDRDASPHAHRPSPLGKAVLSADAEAGNRRTSGGEGAGETSREEEKQGRASSLTIDDTSRKSRRFRERRLSKDVIPDSYRGSATAEELAEARRAELAIDASDSVSPGAIRPSQSHLDSTRPSRKLSLDELVTGADTMESVTPEQIAKEEGDGSPGSIGSPGGEVKRLSLGGSRCSSASSLGGVSDSDTEATPGLVRREGRRPTLMPKTAEPTDKALLMARQSVAFSAEMGTDEEDDVSFSRGVVGTYSCHGLEPGPDGVGAGKINQDCACMGHPFGRMNGTALFCVYDGHGKHGHDVSGEVMHTVYSMLEASEQELLDEPGGTIADAFVAVNNHLKLMACEEIMQVNAMESGTCAIVSFMHGHELWSAGVGDCRCVLATAKEGGGHTAIQLSTDHKVNLPAEQERIESMGGWVRPPSSDEDGEFVPARMYESKNCPALGPGLCVSRALGDLNAASCGLIPTPEVFYHCVGEEDDFIILASDGVWEFIENDEAVDIVNGFFSKGLPAQDACRYLIAKAAICWRTYEGDYRDDITAIVVYLREVTLALEEEMRTRSSSVEEDEEDEGDEAV